MKGIYWRMVTNNMYTLLLYNEHFERCVLTDRVISIFLAVAASSAIASWAIWQQLGFTWAVIIAASQVLTVINAFLPYKKRIKQISSLKDRLVPIYNEMESKVYDVYSKLSDDEIHVLYYDLMKKWTAAQEEFFDDDSLPDVPKFKKHAEELKDKYFNVLFGRKSEPEDEATPQSAVVGGGVPA